MSNRKRRPAAVTSPAARASAGLTREQRWQYRFLHDSKLSILLALLHYNRPMRIIEIASLLGLNEKTAARHLLDLEQFEFVRRIGVREGYALCPGALEPLLIGPIRNLRVESTASSSLYPSDKTETAESAVANRRFPTPVPGLPPASAWQGPGSPFRRADIRPGKPALPDPTAQSPPLPPPPPENLAVLSAQGIGEPKRSQLARLEHLTPDYVRGWVAELRQRPGGFSTGLLVHILENGDPLPADRADPLAHPPDCTCLECLMGSYLCQVCRQQPCECDVGVCELCGADPCVCAENSETETGVEHP